MATSKKNNLVVLNEEAANDRLNATINVSNTDLVTMLVVKNRKILQDKRTEISAALDVIFAQQAAVLKSKVDKLVDKAKLIPIADAYLAFVQLLNPKMKLSYEFQGISEKHILDIVVQHYYYKNQNGSSRYRSSGPSDDHIYIRNNSIRLSVTTGDENKDEHLYWAEGGEPYLPCKINVKMAESKEVIELYKELNRIDNLLKNEKALKEEIIANLTEQTVMNSSMLTKLTSGIKMIE